MISHEYSSIIWLNIYNNLGETVISRLPEEKLAEQSIAIAPTTSSTG